MEITKLKSYLIANLRSYVGKFTVEFFYSGRKEAFIEGYKQYLNSPIDELLQSADVYIGSRCTMIVSGQRDGTDGYGVRIDGTVRQVLCSDLLPHEEE